MRNGWRQRLWYTASAGLGCVLISSLWALSVQSGGLTVRWNPDQLEISAPRLHFLNGRSLARLHDGATVPFDFQLTLLAGAKTEIFRRVLDRFAVSYDLWEEKFSVVRLPAPRRSVSHLSAAEAETWCIGNMLLPSTGIPADRPLWMRLEVRSEEPRDLTPALGDDAISLASLIELFSKPSQARQQQWTLETAAFHLSDFKPGDFKR